VPWVPTITAPASGPKATALRSASVPASTRSQSRAVARPDRPVAADDEGVGAAVIGVVQRHRPEAVGQFPPRRPAHEHRAVLDLVDVARVVGGDERREERHGDDEAQHAEADHRQPVLDHQLQRPGGGAQEGRHVHRKLTRGSSVV
jgi:hypothetical protein